MLLLLATTACTGCAPIPFIWPTLPHDDYGKPINEKRITFIRPGVTTKADVVWELGAPDESGAVEPDESGAASEDWISYRGRRVRGGVAGGVVFIPLFGPPASPGGVERICRQLWVLTIWFDDGGVVTRREFTEGETQCQTQSL
jgi:hypothetical protein